MGGWRGGEGLWHAARVQRATLPRNLDPRYNLRKALSGFAVVVVHLNRKSGARVACAVCEKVDKVMSSLTLDDERV